MCTPPNFLFLPVSLLRTLSSLSMSEVLKKLTSSRTRTLMFLHSCLMQSVILTRFKYAALWTVVPPKMAAEDPVVDVKVKVLSSNRIASLAQKLWQNLCAKLTHVLLPLPPCPVTSMTSWSMAPCLTSSASVSALLAARAGSLPRPRKKSSNPS